MIIITAILILLYWGGGDLGAGRPPDEAADAERVAASPIRALPGMQADGPAHCASVQMCRCQRLGPDRYHTHSHTDRPQHL